MFCAATMVEMSTKNMAEARSSLCPIVDFAFFAIVTPALLFIPHLHLDFPPPNIGGKRGRERYSFNAFCPRTHCSAALFNLAGNNLKTCRDNPFQPDIPRFGVS